MGKACSVEEDDAFEQALTEITTDEDFPDALADWVKEASNRGGDMSHGKRHKCRGCPRASWRTGDVPGAGMYKRKSPA